MGRSDPKKKKKKIRADFKESTRTSGTTPSGSTDVPPLRKKAYQEGLLGGDSLPSSRRSKGLNVGGQTLELALEVSRRLVLGLKNRSSGVGGSPHRRRVGKARVQLSEPVHSRERTGRRLVHEVSRGRRNNNGVGPDDNRRDNRGGLVGGSGRRLHRPGRRSRNSNNYPSWRSYGRSALLLNQVCGRHIRVRDPRRVDEERFGSGDGRMSIQVDGARSWSVRPHLSGVGGSFFPLRAFGLEGGGVSSSFPDERSGRGIGGGGWYSRSSGWDHSRSSSWGHSWSSRVERLGSPASHKVDKQKSSDKIHTSVKAKNYPAARGRCAAKPAMEKLGWLRGRGADRSTGRFEAAPAFFLGALEVPAAWGSLRGRLPSAFRAGASDSAPSSPEASESLVQLAMKRLMEESDSPLRRTPSVAVRASVSVSDTGAISRSTSSMSARSGWYKERACPSSMSLEATNS